MSYSRRQLYAMGEPLGDGATRQEVGGKRIYGGGGSSGLESRVAALESRLSGFGPRGVFVCITGNLSTVTFLTR
jgi:hypothetical protein